MAAYSQYQQGQAQSKAAEFNAAQENYNAKLSEGRAGDALTRGRTAAGQLEVQTQREIGAGRAGFAAGNVDLSSQSVKFWELDTATAGATDVKTTLENANQESRGLQAESFNARQTSRLNRMQGASAARAGMLGAGSSLLAGASQTAYSFNNRPAGTSWYRS